MVIHVSPDCWTRWEAVIQHIAAEFGFPASTLDELNGCLRMYTGGGSTFRFNRERYKFVLDVLRRGYDIIDIVALTVTAKSIEDERHNGAVITRACRIHPNNDDDEYVGAPELKWYVVTSGGGSFAHCCDKETFGPDRVLPSPRLSWETSRLKIIQKAYEQEVIQLRTNAAKLRENADALSDTISPLRRKTEKQARTLTRRNGTIHEQLVQIDKKTSAIGNRDLLISNLRRKLDSKQEERDLAKWGFQMTISELEEQALNREEVVKRQKEELASLLTSDGENEKIASGSDSEESRESENLRMRVTALEKENDVKTAIIKNLRTELDTMHQQNNTMKEARIAADSSAQLQEKKIAKLLLKIERRERKLTERDEQLQDLTKNIDSVTARANEAEELQQKIEQMKIEENCRESQNMTQINKQLRKDNQDLNLRLQDFVSRLKETEGRALRSNLKISQLESELEYKNNYSRRVETELKQCKQEAETKQKEQVDELGRLGENLKQKEGIKAFFRGQESSSIPGIGRGQHLASEPTNWSFPGPFKAEDSLTAFEQAQERTSDLESKLKAMEQAMRDKTDEISALNTQSSNNTVAMLELEQQIADKEEYTAGLEKKLEEMKSTMESAFGAVSAHRDRKRRRIEGLDVDLSSGDHSVFHG
ncbi:hypothetical protein Cob_v010269 [Colletotrichum orbiculare MAFF 240422]|uniref:Uncharacterized protein n=1 Tax=Colletotrichum orbiculare (strain 104-T / ATCC 96160 / CBS 514.97 / LARS 414 / MAFF 240422) TaxID=1213857 RepID=N4VLB8_COLOR|nr:hypothetical protein Cob_v010269 [Colletotrichum orbiculare MAFF 240422]